MLTCIDCAATAVDSDPIAPPEGWGWVRRPDTWSASGYGPFLACPEHRCDTPYWPQDEKGEQEQRGRTYAGTVG
jgi:hypothetical protein